MNSLDSAPPVTPERYTPDGDEPIISISNTNKLIVPITYEITEQPGEEESDDQSPEAFELEFKMATRELVNSRNDIVVSKTPKNQIDTINTTSDFEKNDRANGSLTPNVKQNL